MKIAVVFGTRPEIIKLAELINLLNGKKGVETLLMHTGQHYSYNLSQQFLEELKLPKINVNLEIGSGTHEHQIGEGRRKIGKFLRDERVDLVLAEGDTNSVAAAALAARDTGTKFAHVEAGLRSFDMQMPEERNRILADDIADFNFAPTETAVQNLKNSNAREESIYLTGNTIVEVTKRNLEIAQEKAKILKNLNLERRDYVFVSAHRTEVVDRKEQLECLLEGLQRIPLLSVWPMHPRTRKNLEEFGLMEKAGEMENLKIIEPVGYLDCLMLCSNSKFIVTDSGGIQEEATIYKKPVLITRKNTERPEILGTFGTLVGWDAEKIGNESRKLLENYDEVMERVKNEKCPFGNGTASAKIAEILAGGGK